ncbi:hypothetical protein SAMN05660464_3410 [Geodermatophilus dictyosporus]|uniref:Secreted protein n=1 Tax=Geodermatophilus dictyosporus TaxID=1523247 RepID=A0A1I5R0E4_9ACTN|nr:hypothetical protein [Geodermatophilus dictyosporus]SFP51972.1 hypothetical protein SAMN05660464_3410 [Geodermatophilus dictyosporus]
MRTAARLGATVVGLAAVLGAGWGLGALVGPVGTPASAAEHAGEDDHAGGGGHAAPAPAGSDLPAGLAVSAEGHTLDLAADALPAGDAVPLSFRLLGPDGTPVTAYDTVHEQDLHLVVVRRDLSGYQHLHPGLAPDGTWTTAVALQPGSWRVLADATPTALGHGLVLGADLAVGGTSEPVPLPAPSPTAEVDGYTVTVEGDLVAGQESEVVLRVARDGVPVTDLQPYLGARGHLVALRAGDLGYLHVHPTGASGREVRFAVRVPAAGAHRLFLDFRHGDVVRTAAVTVDAR